MALNEFMTGISSRGSLWRPEYEHDACGVGFIADISGHKSRRILDMAIESVVNLIHRGAVAADTKTGDGAGVLTQIPLKIVKKHLNLIGSHMPEQVQDIGIGMVFLPTNNEKVTHRAIDLVEQSISRHGLILLSWRIVPTNNQALGNQALQSMPNIRQVIIARPDGMDSAGFQRALYLVRKNLEFIQEKEKLEKFHIVSMSNTTLVYKGLVAATQLGNFYLDLNDPDYETSLAIFHQRYSTNTLPNWTLAQPFRFLAHNGEINTLQGNKNWIKARENELNSSLWGKDVTSLSPIIAEGGSDSASLDNVLEALVLSGRGLLQSMAMLVPEAWENMPNMPSKLREFYEYHACITEPWDGPASLVYSDGRYVSALLDRNGLRPARYLITDDNIIIMGSEVGMVEIDESKIIEKGRLGPGQMIAVDTREGKLLKNQDIKNQLSSLNNYGEWLNKHMVYFDKYVKSANLDFSTIKPSTEVLRAFGYTSEEMKLVILPMVSEAKEPVGSMGDDTPLSILSDQPRLLYTHFKQRFAQVTNPAIDPLREHLVMSLNTYVGSRNSLIEESPAHARLISLNSPIMLDHELTVLRNMPSSNFKSITISTLFSVTQENGMKSAIERICQEVLQAVDNGNSLIILSDKGVDTNNASIPMLLSVGAVHHRLIREGKRMKVSIIAETGEARDMHHIVTLIGYGASVVNPYLGCAVLRDLVKEEHGEELSLEVALNNYKGTIEKQILKIMSKMGISAVSSYMGGQIFEVIGLSDDVIDLAFTGTSSSISGIGIEQIAKDTLIRHHRAFFGEPPSKGKLEDPGYYRFRKTGEYHAFNPRMVRALHKAVAENGTNSEYNQFLEIVTDGQIGAIRDLLDFKSIGPSIPINQVEPAKEIVKRFNSASMSLGALSPEAHEVLGIAMNRIGGKSNTGEGGEASYRFRSVSNSRIKQVASGRFGVTPEYLVYADEIEIKMAQGSKPGEGGQLPGHKVVEHIAAIRHTQPGVPLISPPPHHDIYSIEDLSQLIYDLKMINPKAKIAVKLVAEAGVGTIAAGVAKGYADVIHISGHEGGTGASPLMSIKYAGSAWELGLAETQQILLMNGLRGKVTLRTDGGIRTARDVLVAAMLGAEEYSFGTTALVAIGCQMARQCHLNTCPVGIATQDPGLRKKFFGTPEMAIKFFFYIAEELRETLAKLGAKTLQELIGHPELLEPTRNINNTKAKMLNLSQLLIQLDPENLLQKTCNQDRNNRDEIPLDEIIIPEVISTISGGSPVTIEKKISNSNRAVGARLAGKIALQYGNKGLLPESIRLNFNGSAGQSFGAFCINGMQLYLEGEANDYVGKGMNGGEIIIRPSQKAKFLPHENTILGNTVLYGATGGYLFASGRAGERFAVRNSGAWAVVEGVGDHCSEYMTGGIVVILGSTGRNFAAGMSGGMAFILDETEQLELNCNLGMVDIEVVVIDEDIDILKALLLRHHEVTDSIIAKDVLDNWDSKLIHFKKVKPKPTVAPSPPRDVQRARRDALMAARRVE